MDQVFIINLGSLFLFAILLWAISAYTELLVWREMKKIFIMISRILRSEKKLPEGNPPDYLIVKGTYKSRNTIVRISHFYSGAQILNYKLSLHMHMEPLRRGKPREISDITERELGTPGKMIFYKNTSTTSIKTYSIVSRVSEHNIISMLEELTYSVEEVEAQIR